MTTFITRHPVLAFYVLVFAISWGGMLLLVGPGGIPGTAADIETQLPAALLVLFAGPSVAGILMTGLVDGRSGYRGLRTRLLRWRVGVRSYAVAFLLPPLLVLAVLLTLTLFSPAFVPGLFNASDKIALVVMGIVWGLVGGGLLEELGWTGFAVFKLRLCNGPLATGLLVGVLWGLWHLLIAFWTSGSLSGDDSVAVFVAGFLAFYFLALPAFRVFMVWVYDRTESLLLAMFMHASLSAAALILQPVGTDIPYLIWNVVLGVVLWGVVAVLAAVQGTQSKQHGQSSGRFGTQHLLDGG